MPITGRRLWCLEDVSAGEETRVRDSALSPAETFDRPSHPCRNLKRKREGKKGDSGLPPENTPKTEFWAFFWQMGLKNGLQLGACADHSS
jgi:hypothetical protein